MTTLVMALCMATQDPQPSPIPGWKQREASARLVERDAGPQAPAEDGDGVSVARIAAWTAVVVGLMAALFFGARKWMRRAGLPGAPEALRVLGRRRLTPTLELIVVDVAGRTLVLGAARESVSTLAELDDFESKQFERGGWVKTPGAVGGGRETPTASPAPLPLELNVNVGT